MKQLITNYTFSKGTAGVGTITFRDFPSIVLERVYLVVDVVAGQIIYQFNSSSLNGTVSSGSNILTLTADTSALSNADGLMVIYDCKTGDPTYDQTPVSLATLLWGEDSGNNLLATLMKPGIGQAYSPAEYNQYHNVTTANIKVVPGNVYSISVTNEDASPRFIQLFNTTTVPGSGASCQAWWEIPGGTASNPGTRIITSDELAPSEYFTTGIAWGVSTAATTYTAATAAEHAVMIRYL